MTKQSATCQTEDLCKETVNSYQNRTQLTFAPVSNVGRSPVVGIVQAVSGSLIRGSRGRRVREKGATEKDRGKSFLVPTRVLSQTNGYLEVQVRLVPVPVTREEARAPMPGVLCPYSMRRRASNLVAHSRFKHNTIYNIVQVVLQAVLPKCTDVGLSRER